jgi:hypothetical protein
MAMQYWQWQCRQYWQCSNYNALTPAKLMCQVKIAAKWLSPTRDNWMLARTEYDIQYSSRMAIQQRTPNGNTPMTRANAKIKR